MYNATAYNHAYLDSGLFCIHASAPPTHARELVEVITREMVAMAGSVGSTELRVSIMLISHTVTYVLQNSPVTFFFSFFNIPESKNPASVNVTNESGVQASSI